MAIKIWLDYKGVEQSMLNGPGIEQTERETMEQKLSEIQGQFIVDFGVEGKFEIVVKVSSPSTKYGTRRTGYRIVAADAKTAAILKRHPGWLGKFL